MNDLAKKTPDLSQGLTRALEQIENSAFADFYNAASGQLRAENGIMHQPVDTGYAYIASQIDTLAFNRVVGIGLDQPPSPDVIDSLIRLYTEHSVPRFFVQLQPLADTESVRSLLQSQRLSHYNNWVKLYRDLEPLPKAESSLRIKQIGEPDAMAFGRIVVESFDWAPKLIPWVAATVTRPGWSHYMAFDEDAPAATGAMFVEGEWCWIDLAATVPAYRKRGAQAAILARRFRDARELGCKYVVVETAEESPEKSAPSYRNMRRYGFRIAYVRQNYMYQSR